MREHAIHTALARPAVRVADLSRSMIRVSGCNPHALTASMVAIRIGLRLYPRSTVGRPRKKKPLTLPVFCRAVIALRGNRGHRRIAAPRR